MSSYILIIISFFLSLLSDSQCHLFFGGNKKLEVLMYEINIGRGNTTYFIDSFENGKRINKNTHYFDKQDSIELALMVFEKKFRRDTLKQFYLTDLISTYNLNPDSLVEFTSPRQFKYFSKRVRTVPNFLFILIDTMQLEFDYFYVYNDRICYFQSEDRKFTSSRINITLMKYEINGKVVFKYNTKKKKVK